MYDEVKESDETLLTLSGGVYENHYYFPGGYHSIGVRDNEKTGFHAQAFKHGNNVIIAFRGTGGEHDVNEIWKDVKADAKMFAGSMPYQMKDAEQFYADIKQQYPNANIIFTGHSLGGSIASHMALVTGNEAVVFAPYGIRHLEPFDVYEAPNITVYGSIKDPVFMEKFDAHIGNIKLLDVNPLDFSPMKSLADPSDRFLSPAAIASELDKHDKIARDIIENKILTIKPNKLGAIDIRKHYTENMDLSKAVDYKPDTPPELPPRNGSVVSFTPQPYVEQEGMARNVPMEGSSWETKPGNSPLGEIPEAPPGALNVSARYDIDERYTVPEDELQQYPNQNPKPPQARDTSASQRRSGSASRGASGRSGRSGRSLSYGSAAGRWVTIDKGNRRSEASLVTLSP